MEDDGQAQPLFKSNFLILVGGFTIMAFTLLGILSDPGEIIRKDIRLGPVIAAAQVLVPLFATIGFIYLLANFKKCKHCGRIFLKRRQEHKS